MQTVRETVETTETTADIYELRGIKPTGVFFYDKEKMIQEYGSRLVEETFIIKGLTGHEAIFRMYLKTIKES